MASSTSIPNRNRKASPSRERGMTLLEVVGTLFIIGILTAIVTQSATSSIRQSAREEEKRRLAQMAQAFEKASSRSRAVPAPSGMSGWLAQELGWLTNDVAYNRRGFPRAFVVDPRLGIGPAAAALPFVQDSTGSVEPVSARILLVSSMATPLPDTSLSGADFDLLWTGTPGTVPSAWSWEGSVEDLIVQRVNMADWFVPVMLVTAATGSGAYGTDANATNALASTVQSAWYLKGTVLRLHGTGGGLQVRHVLQDAEIFSHEHGVWRGRQFTSVGRRDTMGLDLDFAAERFIAAAGNPSATPQGNPVLPPDVLDALQQFLEAYRDWGANAFPGNTTATYQALQSKQASLETKILGLIHKP